MRHQMGGRKLGRPTDHRLAMIRNQITDLLRYEKVRTTEAKARELRREAEKVITLAKHNDVHHRRLALTKVYDPRVVDQAVRRDRAAHRGPAGRLHPDGQADAPQGRRRADGAGGAGPLGSIMRESGEGVRTVRLDLAYEGTRYHGFGRPAEPHDDSGGAGRGARPIAWGSGCA